MAGYLSRLYRCDYSCNHCSYEFQLYWRSVRTCGCDRDRRKVRRDACNDKIVSFPQDAWQELLEENKGDSLLFTVCIRKDGEWKQYRSFPMYVSPYPIDYGVVYRKLAPGYEVYSKMGIYERDLASFEERPLLENTMVPGMCLNCHAFNKTNPDRLSLHIRGKNGGTLMQIDGKREMLDTKTDSTLSAGCTLIGIQTANILPILSTIRASLSMR